METLIVLVIVFLMIRGLAKLGEGEKKRTKIQRSRPTPPRPSPTPPPPPPPRPKARSRPGPARSKFPASDDESHSDAYVRYLIDVLRVGQPAASQQAVNRLAEMGRQALPALREAERDPSAFVRERAQQAIEMITGELELPGSPSATPSEPPPPEPTPEPPPSPAPPPPRKEDPLPPPTPEPEPERPGIELPDARPSVFDTPIGDTAGFKFPELPAQDDVEVPAEDEEEEPAPAPEPDEVAVPAAGPIGLDALLTTLREAAAQPSFGGKREEVLARLDEAQVRFDLRAERTQWTMGLDVSESHKGGRTVSGHIADTDVPVAVCLPPASNEVADALADGDRIPVTGTYVGWDGLYDRGKFEGRIVEAG